MPDALTTAELNALRRITSPTVANSIETFDLRPRNQGFFDASLRCLFPEMSPMVGYAVTATIRASTPRPPGAPGLADMVRQMREVPRPHVVVIQDLDRPPVGSYWGEVNGSTYKALGVVGVLTDGGVRDLDEVREMGFHFFASCVLVSHAYVHLVEVGKPVDVGGLTVRPGDLIHADKHGALLVPHTIARDIPRAAAELEERERRIIDYCQSPEFTPEGLLALRGESPPTEAYR
jgi:regulator of RNase E activity RraA